MPNVLSQETVFGEFNSSIPADIVSSLRAHITGPEAQLRRYAVSAEKALINLGSYNPSIDVNYNWPNKAATAIVDLSYVKLFIDDALLQYYQTLKSTGDVISPVAGYKNRIKTDSASGWKLNGAYARIAALKDRNVTIGDVVHLKDGVNELWTTVADLIADPVAASIAAATEDAANAVNQPNSAPGAAPTVNPTGGGASGGLLQAGDYYVRYTFTGAFGETWASSSSSVFTVSAGNIPRVTIPALPTGASSAKIYLTPTNGAAGTETLYKTGVTTTTTDLTTAYATGGAAWPKIITQTAGTVNNVGSIAADSSTYTGLATGDITETYTITVIQASSGGDATTALIQITSASGRDDVASVAPAAFASPTTIGTRNLTVTWTTSSSNNFLVGQVWQITVRQAWTKPTVASGGTFTGAENTSYIVQVTLGGTFAGATKPQITVTTAQGSDTSGPTNVTTSGAAVSIGTLGVTMTFTGTALRKGDLYYAVVTGPTEGSFKTIVLANNLTTALQASSDMDFTLFIRKNIEVTEDRLSDPPNINWSTSSTQITTKSGITAYDSTLTDAGVAFAVPVKGGTLYSEYRAWKADLAEKITEVTTIEDVKDVFGESNIHPDNPLAYAAKKAVENNNGVPVRLTAVHNPATVSQWEDVLDILEGYKDIYSLVPLTRNTAVITAFRNHVVARSSADIGGEYRTAWFNIEGIESIAIVNEETSSDGEVVMATLGDDPGTAGTQYTLFSVTTGNSDFVTLGVTSGDVVRFIYSIDAFGNTTYQSFIVDEVINEETLKVVTGHNVAVSVAQKVEVWRTLSKTQIATNVAEYVTDTAANKNTQLRFLWPDRVEDDDGLVVEGYHLCVALAAMISGIAPHQGLRNLAVNGFLSATRSTSFFNNAQLNLLAEAGFVVVSSTSALSDGTVYVRTARTTDLTSVATREEATARLDDAIRYLFYNRIQQFFGSSNLSTEMLSVIDTELKAAVQHGMTDTRIERIGAMISDGSVKTLRRHVTIPDRLVVEMNVTRGYPLNDASIILVFSSE